MNWSRSRVLVTGAGGFIGSHLTQRLLQLGARVRVLVRYNSRNHKGYIDSFSPAEKSDLEIFVGDLKDPNAVANVVRGVDMVFHLGAIIAIPYSYINPFDFFQTNIIGSAHVINACLKYDVERIIHTSTSEVYGSMKYCPIDETHPLEGKSPYAASKIGADQIMGSYYHSFGLKITTVRPFNTYGPRQSLRAIIPTIITQALNNDRILIGALHPTRDFNFVSDTVAGMIKCATSEDSIGEVVNLGNGKEISIQELCSKICKLVGRKVPIVQQNFRMRPGTSEVDRLCCDNLKAQKILEWQPRVSLDDGLRQTIDWIKQTYKNAKIEEFVI